MKIFTEQKNIEEKFIRITDKGDIRHMLKVMRMKEGDQIDVSDSVQWEYRAEILSADEDLVLLSIWDKQKSVSYTHLDVYKRQVMQKGYMLNKKVIRPSMVKVNN